MNIHSNRLEATVPSIATTEQVELSFDTIERIDELFYEGMSIEFSESGADRELDFDKESLLEGYDTQYRLNYLLAKAHF
jgi:hypothetical protein